MQRPVQERLCYKHGRYFSYICYMFLLLHKSPVPNFYNLQTGRQFGYYDFSEDILGIKLVLYHYVNFLGWDVWILGIKLYGYHTISLWYSYSDCWVDLCGDITLWLQNLTKLKARKTNLRTDIGHLPMCPVWLWFVWPFSFSIWIVSMTQDKCVLSLVMISSSFADLSPGHIWKHT